MATRRVPRLEDTGANPAPRTPIVPALVAAAEMDRDSAAIPSRRDVFGCDASPNPPLATGIEPTISAWSFSRSLARDAANAAEAVDFVVEFVVVVELVFVELVIVELVVVAPRDSPNLPPAFRIPEKIPFPPPLEGAVAATPGAGRDPSIALSVA